MDNNVDIPDMYPLVLLPGEDAVWPQRSCFKWRDAAQRAGRGFKKIIILVDIIIKNLVPTSKRRMILIRSDLQLFKREGTTSRADCL